MHDAVQTRTRPTRLSVAVSLAMASLVTGAPAHAQQAQPAEPAAATARANDSDSDISKVVITTRRSQQSSISRKKNAATAMDSIVAEDVGSLPDRNIGEAISRMAGVAVERGDYGEGINVSVRGNGPELTRVELDGQAVQSAGGTDMNGGGDGRGTEFRQLSADLIKSVDVVKGATADMTEGSLGGGIIIKTRTGLDFDKPFLSIRAAGTQSSLNKKWDPDTNLILSNKFLDGRLGVLLNASATRLTNESHQFQTSANGSSGYMRAVDFDNSPQKTFTFHPETLDTANPASTRPIAQYARADGSVYSTATPLDILTRSAAAQTKADCFTAFPALTTSSATLSGLSSANKTSAVGNRTQETLSCLNQWNDYMPPLVRYFVKRQIDERRNLDLRTDFKVNKELTVYAKGSYSKRTVDDNFLTYSLGNASINGTTPYSDSAAGVRTATPGSGYFTYPTTYSSSSGKAPIVGAVGNVDPASVVVDSTHHVTQYTLNHATTGVDQIRNQMDTSARYLQLGGTYSKQGLVAEFFVSDSFSDFHRGDKRSSWSYDYGQTTLALQPNGIWAYKIPAGANLNDWSRTGTLLPATSGTQPQYTTASPSLLYTPQIRETGERTAKLDLSYATPESVPFIKRLKSGFNLRDNTVSAWGSGGYTVSTAQGTAGQPGYVPAVTVPTSRLNGGFVGCENTAGSRAAGGTPCNYGYTPASAGALYGQTVLTQQQFLDLITAAMHQPATSTRFFNGASGRPDSLVENWTQIDVDKLIALTGAPNFNLDCIKRCMGSDGKMYDQPVSRVKESTQSVYLMADFGLDHIPFTGRALPFGLELEGNMGYRYVRTKVEGTGSMKFTTTVKTAQFDPNNPGAAAGKVSTTTTQNTTINATTHDILPIYNLAMWLIPDTLVTRYSHAKSVARPPASRLVADGDCVYDETVQTVTDEASMTCSTFGNPALRPQTNINQNLSVEWYPNKDTMFSVSAYKQDGKIGPNITQQVTDVPIFAGSDLVDAVTGIPLADMRFDYTTYVNGPAPKRTGVEFSSKTAFTFLPWKLRYTGLDANFTRQHSNLSRRVLDFLNGEALPPANEPRYSYNWALWYDDGAFQARVAVQAVATKYTCIAPCANSLTNYSLNIYPNTSTTPSKSPAYNPGSPNWKDMTRYVDGKIGYRFNKNWDVFLEGRNLLNQTMTTSIGPSAQYADGTPNLQAYYFAGRRITLGLNYRN